MSKEADLSWFISRYRMMAEIMAREKNDVACLHCLLMAEFYGDFLE